MTFTGTKNQKLLTLKPSVETATKRNSLFNETTERKTETGKLEGGGNSERLMKDAHAYKSEKEETGLNESPTKNERFEKTVCVRVHGGRKRD